MPRNISGLRRGGPGRPKGLKNRETLERDAYQWAVRFFKTADYFRSAERRILAGRAPHLEGYWLPRIHGKAADKVELSGDLVLRWQDETDA